MTVGTQTLEVIESGNGSDTDFDFSFKVFANTDIKVYKEVISTGVETLQELGVDYTVTLNTSTDGGTVTFTTPPSALEYSVIRCDVPATQSTSFETNGKFSDSQVENALDRAMILIQQLEAQVTDLISRVETLEA